MNRLPDMDKLLNQLQWPVVAVIAMILFRQPIAESIPHLQGSLSWPVVVLVGLVLFYKPISELIPLTTRVKAPGFDIQLERLRRSREAVHENLPVPPPPSLSQLPPAIVSHQPGRQILSGLPVGAGEFVGKETPAATEAAWNRLCRRILKTARSQSLSAESTDEALDVLARAGLLPASFREAFEELRKTRAALKKAPRHEEIPSGLADEFVKTCSTLRDSLYVPPA